MKKYLLTILSLILTLPVFAFEDCIISANGKLTDIRIQNNDVIDVCPLITIMNDKNTLLIHPLKEGSTKFSVIKDNKDKYIFNVNVTEENTTINDIEGFDVFVIDCPPGVYEYYFDLDEPPVDFPDEYSDSSEAKNRLKEAREYEDFINSLDEPPVLRGE